MLPSAPSDAAGITTNTAPFAPPSLVARIGSPTEIEVIVILPMMSSDRVRAAGGTTSVFILTSFRSAAVIWVFGGISRAATTMLDVGIGAGASDLAVLATKKVVAPAPTANKSPTISTSRARRRDRSSTITFLYGPFVCGAGSAATVATANNCTGLKPVLMRDNGDSCGRQFRTRTPVLE